MHLLDLFIKCLKSLEIKEAKCQQVPILLFLGMQGLNTENPTELLKASIGETKTNVLKPLCVLAS